MKHLPFFFADLVLINFERLKLSFRLGIFQLLTPHFATIMKFFYEFTEKLRFIVIVVVAVVVVVFSLFNMHQYWLSHREIQKIALGGLVCAGSPSP